MTDDEAIRYLTWLVNRQMTVHGENPDVDWMVMCTKALRYMKERFDAAPPPTKRVKIESIGQVRVTQGAHWVALTTTNATILLEPIEAITYAGDLLNFADTVRQMRGDPLC